MSDGGKLVAPLTDAVGVNVGNPHAIFFVDDVEGSRSGRGPDPVSSTILYFLKGQTSVLLRCAVATSSESGCGSEALELPRACGTAACGVAVAGARRDLTDRAVGIELDGGTLHIVWRDDGHVLMTGPVSTSFSGVLDDALLNGQSV